MWRPRPIGLINPNGSAATTDMMVALARVATRHEVVGRTATRAPDMIVTPDELARSAGEVVEMGGELAPRCAGLVVAAFGDPGLEILRVRVAIPVVGIAEASMLEASRDGRRFGVATTTPGLVAAIAERADALGLGALFTGTRCTPGNPAALMADPDRLRSALAAAIRACIQDGAEAVIVGGGPLGRVAAELRPLFAIPVVAPIPSAVLRLSGLMEAPGRGSDP